MTSHPASWPIDKLLAECQITRTRRSGPGGQHRNKTETAVIIRHKATGTSAEANECRSQEENRQKALFRLRVNLALSTRSAVAENYQPSALWRSRCREGRVSVNPQHDDFPTMLAEALDVLGSTAMNVKTAAKLLGCTSSQLIKLLQQESRAIAQANKARDRLGLHQLK